MASTKEYLDYVLEQLRDLEEVTYRPMMGEYILYYQGKVFGGIYDDRFLVKDTLAVQRLTPNAGGELPYEGAKSMRAPDIDDRELMKILIPEIVKDLGNRKQKNER